MRQEYQPGNPVLYHHAREDVYECMGCGSLIEVPRQGVLQRGQAAVPIANNPENRMMWLELHTLDHEKCEKYKDFEKAEQARTLRRHPLLLLRGSKASGGCLPGNANA